MAGKGSVNIKIGGDASEYQKELNDVVKSTEAAASKIDNALSDAAESLSKGLSESFKAANKDQTAAVKGIGDSVKKIVSQNNDLISQKGDLGNVYDKLGEGAKNAAVKVKAGLADIKAGIDMAVVAADKLSGVVAKGVNYNATIEQMRTSFEVMTGSAEKAAEVVDTLRVMGAETPFEMTDLAGTTQLLMQYGLTADDAINKMRMLGDIAQGNSEAMTSIAMGYAQMSSAGKVNLQDIKQMINGGFNPLQEISERTGESMASLYDRISKGTMTIDEITQSMVSATSEGGKFYQSMEKQSQTLNGQLSTLKDNANQLLGTLTEGLSGGLRDELFPAVNGMIGELESAFSTNGIQGLLDSASNMIPRLMDMMSGELETALSGLSKWLPKGASVLMKAVPGALKAASSAIPQITSVLFEVAGVVLGDLAAMLPELVPVIAEGMLNLAQSAFTGTIGALNGLGEGLEKAMKKIGLIAPTAGEAFAAMVESVDQVTIDNLKKTIDVDIETEMTVDDYQGKIDTAVDTIENALKNIPGLSEAEQEEIKQAIIEGSGMDALQVAFDEMNVDSTAATTAITTAQGNINGVIENLGLSDAAKEHIQGLIENNADAGDIQSAIESFGIDSGAASTATEQITTEMNTLNAALTGLGLDPAIVAQLQVGLFDDKMQVESALKLLGLNDASIAEVLTSYDTVAGSLTAGIDGIYQGIADMFTDGIPESNEDVARAKESIEGIATEAQERVDKWYADKVAELKTSGLDEETVATELAGAKAQYDSLTSSIQTATDTALTQTESMVGQSTAYCKEQVKTLRETFGILSDITAEIDMLTSEDISEAKMSRRLTIEGVTNDTGTHLEAFLITYKEYTDKVKKAEADYLAAIDEARTAKDKGGTDEDYAAAEKEARKNLDTAKQHAADYYQQYVDQILAGVMMANPDMSGILNEALAAKGTAQLVQDLDTALTTASMSNAEGKTQISLEDILGQFEIDETGITNLAESMGLTPEVLLDKMQFQLNGDGASFSEKGAEFMNSVNEMISGLLNAEGIDLSSVTGTLSTAIASGYLLPGINGVDYTSANTIWNNMLQNALNVSDTLLSETEQASGTLVTKAETGAAGSGASGTSKGGDFASGYVSGIKAKINDAWNAGYRLAKAAAAGTASGQASASPSKVAKGLGGDFGDGYSIGLQDSMSRAVLVAKKMTGEIATAATINQNMRVANMPNLQQEIISANEQNKTPVYLDGYKIAEIQGYNNSTTIAWNNTRASKGVGGR